MKLHSKRMSTLLPALLSLRASCTAIILVLFVTGSNAAQSCCTPGQWLGQEWYAGEEGGMVVGCRGTVHYDANNARLRLDYNMNVSYSANVSEHLEYTLWFEYDRKIFYYYNNLTKDCAPFPSNATFPHFCTDAYGPRVSYIGNAQIGGATAQLWGNSTFQLALTAVGCSPIFTRAATSTLTAGIDTIYWGAQFPLISILDVVPSLPAMWFRRPQQCNEGAMKSFEDLPDVEAAAIELAVSLWHHRR